MAWLRISGSRFRPSGSAPRTCAAWPSRSRLSNRWPISPVRWSAAPSEISDWPSASRVSCSAFWVSPSRSVAVRSAFRARFKFDWVFPCSMSSLWSWSR